MAIQSLIRFYLMRMALARLAWRSLIAFSLLLLAIAYVFSIRFSDSAAVHTILAQKMSAAQAAQDDLQLDGASGVVNLSPLSYSDWLVQMEKIFRLAKKHDVELVRGDYTVRAPNGGLWQQYVVNLSTQESAQKTQNWLQSVKSDIPHAIVEKLSIKKDSGDVQSKLSTIEMQITLVFIVRL